MRVFLTGGSGYIGSAVLDAFARAGHHVDALVRNSKKAAMVQARGGHPILGDLSEPASYADVVAMRRPSPASATCRSRRRGRRWDPTPTRSCSINLCAVHARARSAAGNAARLFEEWRRGADAA